MRLLFSWQLSALLLVAVAAAAKDNPNQSSQPPSNPPADSTPSSGTDAQSTPSSAPSITVIGKVPPLPKLAPDQFTECYANNATAGPGVINWVGMQVCEAQLDRDTRVVIDKCINRAGESTPAMAIQACTELLDRKILEGRERFYLFVNRAKAYFAQCDKARSTITLKPSSWLLKMRSLTSIAGFSTQ